MKLVKSLLEMNIARYTGLRLGTEANSQSLVLFVVLRLGVKLNCAAAVGEKEKETVLITDNCLLMKTPIRGRQILFI